MNHTHSTLYQTKDKICLHNIQDCDNKDKKIGAITRIVHHLKALNYKKIFARNCPSNK